MIGIAHLYTIYQQSKLKIFEEKKNKKREESKLNILVKQNVYGKTNQFYCKYIQLDISTLNLAI